MKINLRPLLNDVQDILDSKNIIENIIDKRVEFTLRQVERGLHLRSKSFQILSQILSLIFINRIEMKQNKQLLNNLENIARNCVNTQQWSNMPQNTALPAISSYNVAY